MHRRIAPPDLLQWGRSSDSCGIGPRPNLCSDRKLGRLAREPVVAGSSASCEGGLTWEDDKAFEPLNFNSVRGLAAVILTARGSQVPVIITLLASVFLNNYMLFSKNVPIRLIRSSQESTSSDTPSLHW